MSKILNLGILAHVDAGKTSLTERILFEAGAISSLGSVDGGTAHTDTMPLEQQRGISIRAAVAALEYNGCQINLIDTPGHPDFIAEVERALSVLDAVVLVVSSVEGVQPQTRRLARAIKSIGLPCVIFCNKIDRTGAQEDSLLTELQSRLGWPILPLGITSEIGTRGATVSLRDLCDERLIAAIANHDDDLLEYWIDSDGNVPRKAIQQALLRTVCSTELVPALFGSAVTGTGVADLLDLLTQLASEATESDQLAAQVFNIERDKRGERVVSMRIWSGELCSRHEYSFHRHGAGEPIDGGKITRLERRLPGGSELVQVAKAGQIVQAHGLVDARVGDVIGNPPRTQVRLFNPVFETIIREKDVAQRHDLLIALKDLADQDPFISLRFDARAGTTSVRLFGDVQKEVIEDALVRNYGIEVDFEESIVICIERPVGSGEALDHLSDKSHPFIAGVGLTVRAGPDGSGVSYTRSKQSLGRLPQAMYVGIAEAVFATLHEGLHGWDVTDIEVELTFCEYADAESTVGDFRGLVPLVLMTALQQADTEVCEPLHRFQLEVPEDCLADAVRHLVQSRGIISESAIAGEIAVITGEIPAANIPMFERSLPGISRGEGDLDYWHHGWQPISGDPPSRPRTDHNPLDRTEYLSRLAGRM